MFLKKRWTEYKLRAEKKKTGFFKLFQYADNIDVVLMVVGTCCSILGGSCFSILSIIFGLMTNSLVTHATQGFSLNDEITAGANVSASSGMSMSKDPTTASITLEEFKKYMLFYSTNFAFLAAAVLVLFFLQVYCWEMVAERQIYKLRQMFFKQILRQDISWYDKNDSGDLSLKLLDDLEKIREGIGHKFSLVIGYLSMFFSGVFVGFIINWRLTSIIMSTGPVILGVSAYVAKFDATSSARERLKYSIAGSIAEEVIMNIRTVVAFCKETAEMKRYKKALEEGRKISKRTYFLLSSAMGLVYFTSASSYGLAFYFASMLLNDGLCTPGSIFTVFLSVITGSFSVGAALPYLHSIAVAFGSASTVYEILDRVPDIDPCSKSGLKPLSVNGVFELKNVSFKYPARPDIEVLHDLSLTIEQGRVVAFVGSSGAGKSTLVGLLLRFYDPIKGKITLDGIPLKQLNVRWFRNQIGVVSQEPILFSSSIADNIRYGHVDASQKEIEEAARLANAHYFISKLPEGYNTLAGERGSQLSGGQKQRIAIARALVRNPKILLLDEATSALDGHSEAVVQHALEKAMRDRTTIVVAHRLSTIRNADKIYVMKDGYVAESGKHGELMLQKGLYYNFVMSQTLVKNIDDRSNLEMDENVETEARHFSRRYSSVPSIYDKREYEVLSEEEQMPRVDIRQLIKLNSEEWPELIIGIISGIICGVMMPIFSILYTEMFVIFILPLDQLMSTATVWAIRFPVLGVCFGLSYFIQSWTLANASEKLIVRLRSMAFDNILRQPISWFDLPFSSSGFLIVGLARDAPLLQSIAGVNIGYVINAGVTIVAGIAISLYFGWKLGLVLACGIPIIAATTYNQQRMDRKNQLRDNRLMEVAGRIANECIQNIRTVQALGNEEIFIQQYIGSLNGPFKEAKRKAALFGISFGISQAVLYVLYAVAFRYGSYLIEIGEMSPQNVYRVFFATAFCATYAGRTLTYLSNFTKAKAAIRRMIYLIERKSEIDPLDPRGIQPEIQGQIEFKNVHFKYPARTGSNVLNGLDFNLETGKTLALVGESGSGKSTVVSLLERFYNASSGSIKVDNYDIAELNIQYLRHSIGIVTQEPCLFDRTIRDNIAYGLSAEESEAIVMQKITAAAKSVNIHNFIISLPLGYDTVVGERGTQLSGGQKQRIALARALVKDPRILLLDEATSALDTESEKIVQEALDKIRVGRTCITIAHRLSTIQNADKIAVVRRGKIVESGTHAELIYNNKNYYYRLTEMQKV